MAFKYFNVKNGLSAGNINLNASNATVETGNLIVSGESNLGSVSNIIITGGSSGQVLTTDGSGNLSFSAGSSNPAPMPYQIDTGETVTVPDKYQGLFAYPITVDGELEIDGILIEVGQDALESVPGQILYDNNGIPSGNAGFTFDPVTGNLAAPGNISGTNFIGNGSQLTGIIAAAGPTISNGTSNVNIAASGGNVTVAVGGTSNIIIATSSGVNVTGTLNSTGNANVGNIGAALGVFTNIAGEGGNISNIQGGNINGTVATSTTAGTVTTNAQPNITSVGTLTSLDITGNVTTGNVSGTTGAFTNVSGNGSSLSSITGANVTGAVAFATTANAVAGANVSGTVSSATTAGTVTTAAQPNITSVGTLSALSVTATITGNVSGSAATITTAAQPNITSVGTLTGLTLANAAVISVGSNTNVGTFTGNFSLSAGSRLNATYADLAEKYVADATHEPGTVLEFGGEFEVTLANTFDSTRVAGVVTTNPAYTMNNECEGAHVATIALQGRVPVKVTGTIAKGDLLVSASNGHAVANNEARAGTIIGKSLENFTGESGVIEVAVGRF